MSLKTPSRIRIGITGAALCLACAFLLAATPAVAQYYGRNKVQTKNLQWQVLTTPHFDIHYYAGAEELAVRASIIAERAYREYADKLDHELGSRVPFILYASHHDFAQTNISDALIGEGTGGFSEPLRNRMVLPYNGSHAEFVHVLRHELVHMFMFDIAFGSLAKSPASLPFFNIPLWFAEGVAEWYSAGWDGEADMFMRDATLHDYLAPLEYAGGFMVYKQGQAAMRMISEDYGEEKLVELWRMIGRTRNIRRALSATLGLDMEELDRLYLRHLRARYWPAYGSLEEPADIARRLTDHYEERSGFNQQPAISPDGERIAFVSARDGLPGIYLMSALDGKVERKLVQGYRSGRFESIYGYRSRVAFTADGDRLLFVARSDNVETLHVLDVDRGEIVRSIPLGLDVVRSPASSPTDGVVALVGTRFGRTDLYLLDPEGGDLAGYRLSGAPETLPGGATLGRLTDDVGDESDPAWSPDGARLAFTFDPRAELDFEFEVGPDGARRLVWARFRDREGDGEASPRSLVLLDVADGVRRDLASGDGRWREAVWTGPRSLVVVDDRSGIDNLAQLRLDPAGAAVDSVRLLTNVVGGVTQPAYAPGADRLAFAAFRLGGWDIFCADGFMDDWSGREPGGRAPAPVILEPPRLVTRTGPPPPVDEPENVGRVEDYRSRLTMDASRALGGGAIYFSSAVGVGMANVITLSDLLGDHRLSFLLNFYGSFDNSDVAASYTYLKRRIDVSVGVFHFKNYYNSMLTSVGELLPDDTFFSERNYGLFAGFSYPLNTFRRIDLELQALNIERTIYDLDPSGLFLVEEDKTTHRLLRPSLSFVHDSAFYGAYGPVTGSRVAASFAPTVALGSRALDRRTATLDLRRYWLPFRRNSFALRLSGAISEGDDPRTFVIGGPFTLRGYDFYDFETLSNLAGSRLAMLNLEYRLPLLDAIVFGWPGRWGLGPFGATLFFDAGAAWNGDFRPFGHDASGNWGFRDLRGDYGFGIRTRIGFLPLKFDWARRTDLRRTGDTVFHFSIGPEF